MEADELDDEIADMVAPDQQQTDGGSLFNRRERVMISSVLNLAEQSIRTVMTDRMEVDRITLEDEYEKIQAALLNSPHSRLVVAHSDLPDEPLGYVHKKELLRALLNGQTPEIEPLVRAPINLPDSCTVLSALEQMRQASTHIAFVVNEFGGFEGLLTLTDILEAIAGELPDASEVEGPDIEPLEDGGYRVNGAVNLAVLRERLGFRAPVTDDYQTLAGLVMSLLDRLPVTGDEVEHADWRLHVTEVKDRRVTGLLLKRIEEPLAAG